ncbi:NADH-quinone oxidoreductase subunit J family protein [Adhaeribacter pallidiroseus]|uniref:NADH-quinone oxidoreductase subunit J n=1 Tax=Adhaeribacter pallidiroseus TaxID=2072847 RepID=A0A369QKG8_9BACT|nr:NADH-quinone oxidoreductase subunit J [Adhaeribacter pallidiroseus]RDC63349.1 NADH:ubiquinone reductase (H(+)-translocating) [Adhaeribacter pallidiroseus]
MVLILFYTFAFLMLCTALLMVFMKNLLHAVFMLLITLLSLAAVYVLLMADFLAVTQLMVYVGGILVLILFGIMLSNRGDTIFIQSQSGNKIMGGLLSFMLFGGLVYIIARTHFSQLSWIKQSETFVSTGAKSTLHGIGINLMTNFALPFEVASVVLLIALMGAAFISSQIK